MSDDLALHPDRRCEGCEFYDRARRPNDGFLAGPKPYCSALGFFIQSTTAAIDCRRFNPRSGVTTTPRT